MSSLRIAPLILVTLASSCAPPIVRLATNEPYRAATLRLPVRDLKEIEVHAAVGSIELTSARVDSVIVVAELRSHDAERLRKVCAPGSRLIRDERGAAVTFRLEQSSRNRCGEYWTVQVPPSFRVRLTMGVGDVKLQASAAQLRVRVSGPGAVRGRIDSPDVDIETKIGNIDVSGRQDDVGLVRVVSDIGKTGLTVKGLTIQDDRRPGPGSTSEAKGQGSGSFKARTRNGRASVSVD